MVIFWSRAPSFTVSDAFILSLPSLSAANLVTTFAPTTYTAATQMLQKWHSRLGHVKFRNLRQISTHSSFRFVLSRWPCLRKVNEEVGKKPQEEKEEALELHSILRSLNSKGRCLVSGSEELVKANFMDDSINIASIRLIDQQACCRTKLSDP